MTNSSREYGYEWCEEDPITINREGLKLFFPNHNRPYMVDEEIRGEVLARLRKLGSIYKSEKDNKLYKAPLSLSEHRRNVLIVLSEYYSGYTYRPEAEKQTHIVPKSSLPHRPISSRELNERALNDLNIQPQNRRSETIKLDLGNPDHLQAITRQLVPHLEPHIQQLVEEEVIRQTTGEMPAVYYEKNSEAGHWFFDLPKRHGGKILISGIITVLIAIYLTFRFWGIGSNQPSPPQVQVNWPSPPRNTITCSLGTAEENNILSQVKVTTDGRSFSITATENGTDYVNTEKPVSNIHLDSKDKLNVACQDLNGDGFNDIAVNDVTANLRFYLVYNRTTGYGDYYYPLP